MAQAIAAQVTAGRDNDGVGREHSAGGVVVRDGKVLLVRVRNLAGDRLWTFPKGHVEKGETPKQAACREVEEETGYRCRTLRPIGTIRYQFLRERRLIKKRVQWFWMEPVEKCGEADPSEVDGVRWASFKKAEEKLTYPTDVELLEKTRKRFAVRA